jgi:hypothetical protein
MKRGRSEQNGNYNTILIGTHTKFEINIPRNETARRQFQFLHSCFCKRFIYSHNRSACFAAGKQADQSWEYINRSQKHEF